jgi:alkanesulfonate monooxygenase SsuD/methylene tetrahydromethanopterin reductase-like flavin-dependent oxidoreductase (luciferase family)
MLAGALAGLLVLGCARGAKQAAATAGRGPSDEPALMASLRASVKPDPAKALALADEGERQFGESPLAEERRALAIRALINLQRIGTARSRAYGFLVRYPNGPYSSEIALMTGVHAPPGGSPQKGP